MPTWINHFRVADKLIEVLDNIDIEYFVIGTIAPDCGKFSKLHGVYKPYTGVTHFTKELKYSKKTDCDYNYVYETYVKNETDIKSVLFILRIMFIFLKIVYLQMNCFRQLKTNMVTSDIMMN